MLAKVLLNLLKYVAYLGLWIGLGFGVFVRWASSEDCVWIAVTAVACASSVAFLLVINLRLSRPRLQTLTAAAVHACPALLLGVVAFSQDAAARENEYERVMELVLAGAVALHVTWLFVKAGFDGSASVHIVHPSEVCSLFGLAASVLTAEDHHPFGFILSLLYVGVIILALHRKSVLPLLTLPAYILLNYRVILHDAEHINVNVLCVYIVYLLARPFVQVFASRTTVLDSWKPVFDVSLCSLRLTLLMSLVSETALLSLTAVSLQHHKEWWVILPLYLIMASLLWLPLHLAYLAITWKLTNRVKKCVEIYYSDKTRGLPDIMASRGLRHFALITYPLLWFNLIVTAVQFIWSWTTMTPETCGLLLVCLPFQMVVISLLRQLSIRLGGTCCGHALVTPAILKRADDGNLNEVHASSNCATRSIRLVTDFFNHHLIEDGGCEYLSDSMTEAKVREKLLEFFDMKTREGNSYDSYLLYYSGPVNEKGDWLLKDGGVLTYQGLMNCWLNHDVSATSRLILVLDTAKSNYWVPLVRKTSVTTVGIQTLFVTKDAEAYRMFNIGDFTADWVDFNCNAGSEVYSASFESPIIVTYGISPYWPNFRFQEPSADEMGKYWRENFSVNLRLFVVLANLFTGSRVCYLCNVIGSCAAVLRAWFWSPDRLDTGHGFKLVRFFRLPGNRSLV